MKISIMSCFQRHEANLGQTHCGENCVSGLDSNWITFEGIEWLIFVFSKPEKCLIKTEK